MFFDFHTHVFPDKIAEMAVASLVEKAEGAIGEKGCLTAHTNGTLAGLKRSMERGGVDGSLILPVCTDPKQFDSVNRFAAEINGEDGIYSFGGIHPDCEDIDGKMSFIKKSGFLGVKIHPDYQDTYIDDEKYVKILECAKEYDLIVVTHSGVDGAYRQTVRCTPDRALNLIRKVSHSKLVLAHLGANELYGEVLDRLCGEDVYFDTAYVLRFVNQELFQAIIQKHGSDKILFGSDSPWSHIRNDVEILKSFGLKQETERKIFCENAKKLLGI